MYAWGARDEEEYMKSDERPDEERDCFKTEKETAMQQGSPLDNST